MTLGERPRRFVICSGGNPRQVRAIADAVTDTLRESFAERPALTEGSESTQWVLLDIRVHAVHRGFGHGLVHMFAEDGTLMATASQSCIEVM